MSEAQQAQLALLKQLHDEGLLNAEQYQAKVAALEGNAAIFNQHEQQVQRQINARRDAVDIDGDTNIVGSHNVVQLYQVYQTTPGKPRLTEAEFAKVLGDYLGWVRREYGHTRLHGLQNLQQTGALDKPLATVYTSLRVQHQPAVEPGGEQLRHRARMHPDEMAKSAPPKLLDMADLLTLGERIAIIGRAGSGKTTYLSFVASTLTAALLGQPLDVRLQPPQADGALPVPLLAPLRFWQVYREQCAGVNRYRTPEAAQSGGADPQRQKLRTAFRH